MSEEQLKAFMRMVLVDTILQEKFKAAADSNAILTIAKEAGFSISAEDLKKELSEEELENVAAGQCLVGTLGVDYQCMGTGLDKGRNHTISRPCQH